MEKQSSHLFLISLFLLLLVSSTSARLLIQKLDQETKAYEINNPRERDMEHLMNGMGSEECGDKDEGCLERRMIAEAHLDYIYTQHHKP
ncbi:putative Phytosulfokine 3 precursor [Tripterygium wilfordii]|uniref:Phytosulfokine n=1 Tax=Tripterygium wilfordii TaxID=458696 RepID=A0A7J7DNZ9_TRIWF|nr:putative phytosulfokines 6 [Tripterygium wilfordii]KAF5747826.1 putative Phytosulfokine 3 precursor [Tripterygium wilfordii]